MFLVHSENRDRSGFVNFDPCIVTVILVGQETSVKLAGSSVFLIPLTSHFIVRAIVSIVFMCV